MPDLETKDRDAQTTADVLRQARLALDLALGAGADDAVAEVTHHLGAEFHWRDGTLEKVQEDASRALAVALYVDGRYSTHTTHDFDPARLGVFLKEAVALTRHLHPDPHRRIPDPSLYEGRSEKDLDLVDPALDAVRRQERIGWCRAMCDAGRADEKVVSTTSMVQTGHDRLGRVSSNGFEGTEEGTVAVLGTVVTLREGETRRPEDHHFVAATHLEDLPEPASVGSEALRRALSRLGSTKVDSRRTTMVVHPEAGAMLVGRMLGALQAGSIQQKRSFLADRVGEPVASSVLTLTDDPLIARGLGSRHFDDEGIAAQPLAVVEDGRLLNYYVDTYYGRKLGWEPTTGSPSNLVVRPGEKDLDGLIRGIEDGILVTSWLGGNANATTGDFSYGVRGHLVRGGEIAEPVAEMNVTGTYLDLLGRLVEVGNDPVPWYRVRTPTLVFEGVQFSGS